MESVDTRNCELALRCREIVEAAGRDNSIHAFVLWHQPQDSVPQQLAMRLAAIELSRVNQNHHTANNLGISTMLDLLGLALNNNCQPEAAFMIAYIEEHALSDESHPSDLSIYLFSALKAYTALLEGNTDAATSFEFATDNFCEDWHSLLQCCICFCNIASILFESESLEQARRFALAAEMCVECGKPGDIESYRTMKRQQCLLSMRISTPQARIMSASVTATMQEYFDDPQAYSIICATTNHHETIERYLESMVVNVSLRKHLPRVLMVLINFARTHLVKINECIDYIFCLMDRDADKSRLEKVFFVKHLINSIIPPNSSTTMVIKDLRNFLALADKQIGHKLSRVTMTSVIILLIRKSLSCVRTKQYLHAVSWVYLSSSHKFYHGFPTKRGTPYPYVMPRDPQLLQYYNALDEKPAALKGNFTCKPVFGGEDIIQSTNVLTVIDHLTNDNPSSGCVMAQIITKLDFTDSATCLQVMKKFSQIILSDSYFEECGRSEDFITSLSILSALALVVKILAVIDDDEYSVICEICWCFSCHAQLVNRLWDLRDAARYFDNGEKLGLFASTCHRISDIFSEMEQDGWQAKLSQIATIFECEEEFVKHMTANQIIRIPLETNPQYF